MGPETWSRIVRVENANRASHYPAVVHALVFELGGLLWFYTATDGTQSFSLHANNLEAEKSDFGPLLRDIEQGFVRHEVLPEVEAAPLRRRGALPAGCVIESYAALRERLAAGERVLSARLLSYHAAGRRAGHTVLAYETPAGAFVVDPAADVKAVAVNPRLPGDPLELARALQPRLTLVKARWLPLVSRAPDTLLARSGGRSKSALLQKNAGPH